MLLACRLLAASLACLAADAPSVRAPRPDDLRGSFEAVGLDPATRENIARDPARAGAIFQVTTVGPGDRPPLFGGYRVEGSTLTFRPRFPLEPGVTYRATLELPGLPRPITAELAIPERHVAATTRVLRVSPTANVLPENLLKFYVEFSAPMGRGEAYEHLSLLDESGKPIDLPFLELGEELWDPSGRRFTILFDPGRIKSGLRPREEAGPVLEAGKSYTLVIDRAWRDADGAALVATHRKPFRVGPADRTPPDPSTWTLAPPRPGARGPLVVRLPEPLDRAMLGRAIGVAGPDGQGLPGVATVGDDETSWTFVPERPWTQGLHQLLVDRSLEDRAGNTIGRPFEVDVFEKIERVAAPKVIVLPFEVENP